MASHAHRGLTMRRQVESLVLTQLRTEAVRKEQHDRQDQQDARMDELTRERREHPATDAVEETE